MVTTIYYLPGHGDCFDRGLGRALAGRGSIGCRCFNRPRQDPGLCRLVKIDPAMLDKTLERVNISLPRRVLHRLDARARRAGETRSGFIARMAIEGGELVSA